MVDDTFMHNYCLTDLIYTSLGCPKK